MHGPEFILVEQPFIDQLISMGWKYSTGNLDHPTATGRDNFRQALLLDDLRAALVRINLDDEGEEWLDQPRVSQAVSALQRHGAADLLEANQEVRELLLKGTVVEGLPHWDHGKSRTAHYIDWQNQENNEFRAINQFRVDEPGGQVKKYIVPDIVLFVNGIPLVVVECKSPYLPSPMEEAINQLQRCSNQRHWIEENEGNEKLFHPNQLLIATHFDEARMGSTGAQATHFLEWKDTTPLPLAEVAAHLGKEKLSSQETLVAGTLRPEILLDIVRHFILFSDSGGKTIKLIPRYQQYRASTKAVERLKTGKTRKEDGEHDRRGGIIWHTQGSGKSFTMVFLVRKMRTDSELRKFKVVVVTDRKDLQKQLSETAELAGEPVKIAKSTEKLKGLLAEKGPGLIFATIQKYLERDEAQIEAAEEGIEDSPAAVGDFPVLNEDESILVLVDEAHRSHASALHANLLKALPNCARIGFTGTPIIMGEKKRTYEIFGDFIDRYTISRSEEDGSTVPILYEGRTADGEVKDGRDLDELFEDMFQERSEKEIEAIKAKYATKGHVLEAEALIEAKAGDMLRHYVDTVLPNGFKAQVVAVSRLATLRYYDAFRKAQAELVAELEALDSSLRDLSEGELRGHPEKTQFLVRAYRHLDTIRELEFAPVISGANNDPPAWRRWTDKAKVDSHIARFKRPLFHEEEDKRDPLAFLIVKSMLLTGFDAPVEQAMYLDRDIRQAELLQAVARVNRTYGGGGAVKSAGLVVDYYGVARHLKEALAAYSEEDVEGSLKSLKDEIPKLRDRRQRVMAVFSDQGIDIRRQDGQDAAVDLLENERLRADFLVKLRLFLTTLDLVLPRPEALPYTEDAKRLGLIQLRARNRYRDEVVLVGKEVGEKVRELIDQHVIAEGIDPAIPPISILDTEFEAHVSRHPNDRAKASEMEHAARYHIRKHFAEDPELYQKLSERLETILDEMEGRWDELVVALEDLTDEIRAGRGKDGTGLDPEVQAPFLGVLRREVGGTGQLLDEELSPLALITVELVDHIQSEVKLADFWQSAHNREVLHSWIVRFLDNQDILPLDRLPEVADRLVELAKKNHPKLIQ